MVLSAKISRSWSFSALIAVVAVLVVCGLTGAAYADTKTAVGVASARASGDTSIIVAIPYSEDTNGDNTVRVQWKLCTDGVYPTPPTDTTDLSHTASVYGTTISGLTANTCYNIKITFNDTDGTTGTNPQILKITSTTDNTLLHNSNRFLTSTKWSTDGGWGLSGTKYGQIVCETCHTKTTTNIKRIKEAIAAPWDTFPGQAGGLGITFQSTGATDGFGNDAGGHTTSTKVCEYCHTTTNYHRYDTTGQSNTTHGNNVDCIGCHSHSQGFYYANGACDSCHGNPPVLGTPGGPSGMANPATGATNPSSPGAHSAHATTRSMKCDVCHKGTLMPTSELKIDIGFYADSVSFPGFTGTVSTGTFTGWSSLSNGYTWNASNTGTTVSTAANYNNACSNIYCHGGGTDTKAALTGGSKTNPSWVGGASEAACGTCHGAGANFDSPAANPPTTGNHVKHAGSGAGNLALNCSDCHSTTPKNMGHVNGTVSWGLNTGNVRIGSAGATYSGSLSGVTAGLAPSASYGACSNIYCHSIVQTASGAALSGQAGEYKTPTWGNTSSGQCGTCHNGDGVSGNATLMATGTHTKHVSTYPIACTTCHQGAGTGTTKHADYNIDVVINATYGGWYTGSTAPGNGYSSCSTVYCHSDVQGTGGSGSGAPTAYVTPTWGGTSTDCGSCHKNMDSDGGATGSHIMHAQTKAIACATCHNGYTESTVTTATHVNRSINLSFSGLATGASYSKGTTFNAGVGYGNCSAACHGDGKGNWTTVTWGSTLSADCTGCHAFAPATGAHAAHVQSAALLTKAYGNSEVVSDSGNYAFGCGNCHPTNISNHGNGTLEVSLDPADGGSLKAKNSGSASVTGSGTTIVCNLTYCHSDGSKTGAAIVTGASPQWGGSFSGDKCANCHGNSPSSAAHSKHVVGIHYYNIYTGTVGLATAGNWTSSSHGSAEASTTINCNVCHSGTVTSSANAQSTACSSCHSDTNTPLTGNESAAVADKALHVNGAADVTFASVTISSKAQIRDNITTVSELNNNWLRNADSYKTGLTPYDTSSDTLDATSVWDGNGKTCSNIACHNGNQATWNSSPISCGSCHTSLTN